MSDRRIFLALDISDQARTACNAHIDSIRRSFPDVRVGWERAEKLHITLKFLGNTTPEALISLQERISDVGSHFHSFQLRLSQPGVFPSKSRPRILWIGVEDRSGAIDPLHKELERIAEELGFERELKRFHPHITIGRVREPANASALAVAHQERKIERVQFEVAEIVIYESKLQPAGSIYSVVARIALSPGKV